MISGVSHGIRPATNRGYAVRFALSMKFAIFIRSDRRKVYSPMLMDWYRYSPPSFTMSPIHPKKECVTCHFFVNGACLIVSGMDSRFRRAEVSEAVARQTGRVGHTVSERPNLF